ncbi:MAG: phenylalanine--tRNA ligase subunit beta, partial [Candidatus Thermoplasmatota archaeon]|nr:phenylalanine--tRNA ligase subunit beta [Candidatus Thermoplasmatota archaeon]
VTSRTKNLLVDVTGTDERAVELCLNILVAAIADRGGKIFSVEVVEGEKRTIYPRMEPNSHELDLKYAREIIGVDISEEDACKALSRMGHTATPLENGIIKVEVPAYRGDILHSIDLVEDLAIGYGYGNVGLSLPQEYTFGKEQNVERKCKIMRKALTGLGYQEAMTFVLSGNRIQFESMGLPVSECVKTENPVTEDYSIMRTSVMPCLLDLLKSNKHRELPQAIFELGDIVDPYNYRNVKMLAGAKISAKANFTEMKSDVEAVMRSMGVKFSVSEKQHPSFVPGRCASVSANGKEIGIFGEISPQVISNFELGCQVIAFEFRAGQV